jgi:hypothetical protein
MARLAGVKMLAIIREARWQGFARKTMATACV